MLRKTIQDVCAKFKMTDPIKVQLRYDLTSTILTIKVIQQRMFFEYCDTIKQCLFINHICFAAMITIDK